MLTARSRVTSPCSTRKLDLQARILQTNRTHALRIATGVAYRDPRGPAHTNVSGAGFGEPRRQQGYELMAGWGLLGMITERGS